MKQIPSYVLACQCAQPHNNDATSMLRILRDAIVNTCEVIYNSSAIVRRGM